MTRKSTFTTIAITLGAVALGACSPGGEPVDNMATANDVALDNGMMAGNAMAGNAMSGNAIGGESNAVRACEHPAVDAGEGEPLVARQVGDVARVDAALERLAVANLERQRPHLCRAEQRVTVWPRLQADLRVGRPEGRAVPLCSSQLWHAHDDHSLR